jgi:hypothetical protein
MVALERRMMECFLIDTCMSVVVYAARKRVG